MDGFDRIYDLHKLLKGRKTALALNDILERMECSKATFHRIRRHMSDYLGAPIEFNRDQGGYRYMEGPDSGYELPGLWFNQQELYALLMIQSLLNNLSISLLQQELSPIKERIDRLLKKQSLDPELLHDRIRILGVATRQVDDHIFLPLAEAVARSKPLTITYSTRDSGVTSCRNISPLCMVNYRNNWYLDTWCHTRQDYRTFAMECIQSITDSKDTFQAIDSKTLDDYFNASYGIYAGDNIEWAVIEFTSDIANRVADELWHPQQKGELLADGRYRLSLPYNSDQPNELLMDIIRHGEAAKLIEPKSLQQQLIQRLQDSLSIYTN
jgi:predicted DNA-binding transcriptional regulator YafY